jgi:hypothetical protein
VLGAQTANSLRVIVKDSATGSALEGATVRLRKVDASYDESRFTGGSVWSQADWSGGAGQATFTQSDRYFADDGNINTTTAPTAVRLVDIGGVYQTAGILESSTFDTGATFGLEDTKVPSFQPAGAKTVAYSPILMVVGYPERF